MNWQDAQRVESWAGETRVNLIRIIALLVFYCHHLLNVYVFRDDPNLRGSYHATITLIVLAWAAGALVIFFCLSRRWLPPALKYAATVWDIALITMVLVLGKNSYSALAALYFLVIFAAALRLSLPLVYVATLGAMAGDLFFLGYLRFWLALPDEQRMPRPHQIIFLLALGGAGILAGQMVRQARRLAEEPAVRVID